MTVHRCREAARRRADAGARKIDANRLMAPPSYTLLVAASRRRVATRSNTAPAVNPRQQRKCSVHELDRDRVVDDTGVDPPLQELPDGASAGVAVVERPVVHIHADKGVSLGSVEP